MAEPMEKYNVWESLTSPDFITIRHADVRLETKYWKLLHTFEAKDRADANRQFREMGYEP
jgi:hypothetical protein